MRAGEICGLMPLDVSGTVNKPDFPKAIRLPTVTDDVASRGIARPKCSTG
jgi:hypothetical protein